MGISLFVSKTFNVSEQDALCPCGQKQVWYRRYPTRADFHDHTIGEAMVMSNADYLEALQQGQIIILWPRPVGLYLTHPLPQVPRPGNQGFQSISDDY